MENALTDLRQADKIIKKRHRYACGLDETEDIKEERARFFFSSPDGQNYELLSELQRLGWGHTKYQAPYFWRTHKDGVQLEYVEGDIYITIKK